MRDATNGFAPSSASSRKIDAAMILLVVIWGLNFSVVKMAFAAIPPLAFNALRIASATVLLLAVLRVVEGPLRVKRADWPGVVALGIVGHTLYQVFFVVGLARTTAGDSSLILSMVPLFVAVLGATFRLERITLRTWVGIVVAFGGLALLIRGGGEVSLGRSALVGDFLILLCAICWASYTVFSRPFLDRFSPLQLTAVSMAAGLPLIVIVGLPDLHHLHWTTVSWQAWVALAYATILAVAVGYVIWYTSVQAVGSARTAVYSNLIPVVALVASWLALGESLTSIQAAGAAVVLLGVWLARSGTSHGSGRATAV